MKKLLFGVIFVIIACFSIFATEDKVLIEKTTIQGKASYYGGKFHGRKTANGEIFDKNKLTAASNVFPLGSMLSVWRVDNKGDTLKIKVKVNDRMAQHTGNKRILDLSKKAMEKLEGVRSGVINVNVDFLPFDELNIL